MAKTRFTLVEHMPRNQEVMGLNPPQSWAFCVSIFLVERGPSQRCNTADYFLK